ncbi:MAG: DUF4276 family protein [Bacteroidales bacterium]|nr:DUF4276 family protein [Bacteroidales bacterium]
MKRIIFICEGPTEQTFCKNNLQNVFLQKNIYIQTPLIKHSKGGIVRWQILKQQIETHLKSDKSAFVTTFIDYYGVYSKYNFPNWENSEKIQDKNSRMEMIEKGMAENISEELRYRFIPYLQLHEFEGLLFNDINIFYNQIPTNDIVNKEELERTFADYSNPEMINNNKKTSPSHRLSRIIKGYNKIVYGDILAEAIGIENIRAKSPRFNNWIRKLENI